MESIKYVLPILLIGLLLFGCTGQNTSGNNVTISQGKISAQQNTIVSQQQNTSSSVSAVANASAEAPLLEINVTAKQWEFVPSTIIVPKGTHVRLFLTSTDVEHGFMLKDYNISVKIEPGQIITVDFVADKAGEFGFRCSVMCGPGHTEQTGKLIVEQ